jgi:hypothetical protein
MKDIETCKTLVRFSTRRLKLPSFQAVEGFKQNIYNVTIGFNEKGCFQQWDGRMDAQFSGKPMPVSCHDFTHFHA